MLNTDRCNQISYATIWLVHKNSIENRHSIQIQHLFALFIISTENLAATKPITQFDGTMSNCNKSAHTHTIIIPMCMLSFTNIK